MDTTQRNLGLVLAAVLIIAVLFMAMPALSSYLAPGASVPTDSGNVTVYFFYGEECPHCHNVIPFIVTLEEKYPDVKFRYLETWHNQTNQQFSSALNRKLGIDENRVPRVIVGDTLLLGEAEIPAKLETAILEQKKKF
jgi:thiol-disulfide isomerase/thioredoxin